MKLSQQLHQIFNDLGYERCGGYCYKKVVQGITYTIDNPFSGWDNEDDHESFMVDFSCFIPMTGRMGFRTLGKITLELSTVFKDGDTIETIREAETDLQKAANRVTTP